MTASTAENWQQNIKSIETNTEIIGANSPTNPIIDEDQVRALIVNGQSFSATTGKQTSGGAVQTAMALFANNIAKNVFVYSVRVACQSSSLHALNIVTSDPAASGLTVTPVNAKASGLGPLATIEAINAAFATTGNPYDEQYTLANTSVEFLQNGSGIFLPAGTTTGIVVLINTSTNVWLCTIKWNEY